MGAVLHERAPAETRTITIRETFTEIESRAPSWHQAELACFGAPRIELLLRIGKKLARQPCGT
jgi:hypothetical protein